MIRSSTNTPLQALVLMNEPQYVEAALAFGRRILVEGGETSGLRLKYGFRSATGRVPSGEEFSLLASALEKHSSRYEKDLAAAQLLVGEENSELAAYTMVASIILNLDELINRP